MYGRGGHLDLVPRPRNKLSFPNPDMASIGPMFSEEKMIEDGDD